MNVKALVRAISPQSWFTDWVSKEPSLPAMTTSGVVSIKKSTGGMSETPHKPEASPMIKIFKITYKRWMRHQYRSYLK